MRRQWLFGWVVLALMGLLLAVPAFAAVSLSVDGEKAGVYENINFPAGVTVTRSGTKADIAISGLVGTHEEVTTTSANPGLAAASLLTTSTTVITDNTGASADVLSLADGVEGQIKIVTLKNSLETAGIKVTPTNILGATTDVLLSAIGDAVMFVFDGTSWNIVTTNGTRQ